MDPLIVQVFQSADGRPISAAATQRLELSPERVWALVSDVERFPGRVPMISRARRSGDHATIDLRFKVSFFSVGFSFTVAVKAEWGKWLELSWVEGEPRDIRLRFDLEPLDGGRACNLRAEGGFDPQSLGWLAKYFLRHHPEIEYGIFPGVALALIDSIRRAAS